MDEEKNLLELRQAATILAAIGNERRLMVISLLSKQEWPVGMLAREVNLSQSALSQHLKVLRNAKLVTTRRNAQTIYYSCETAFVFRILNAMRLPT